MIEVKDVQNAEGPSAENPSGKLKNKAGTTAGTALNEDSLDGPIQFFMKLMRDSGTAFNGLPENTTNGFQLFTAFTTYVRNFLKATTSAFGSVRLATTAEREAGTSAVGVMSALDVNSVKTFNKGVLTVAQVGGTYVIPDTHDMFVLDGSPVPEITMPSPDSFRNRMIGVFGDGNTFVVSNTKIGESQQREFLPYQTGDYTFLPGGSVELQGRYLLFLSDGVFWHIIGGQSRGLACPYIYLNGVYFDEILKNQVGIESYREETIDITGVLKVGDNVIRLSEEKKETTFIDYLILTVDGKETVLFNERKTLQIGDFYDFNVNIESNFEKATLKAKGYYIRG